ncbi:MAG: hypothetical protein B7Z73_03440, partial [Planctomycetia bacterium 21-64-5]
GWRQFILQYILSGMVCQPVWLFVRPPGERPISKTRDRSKPRYERAIFTLPPELLAEARRFANAFHKGNNSGFVAAAIRNYIDHLRKVRPTARLRESYAAAATDARNVAEEWDPASEQAWAMLDRAQREDA